jgi:hypothetical protein
LHFSFFFFYFFIIEDRKRKFDENEIIERKKPCGIWSLADMAEKDSNKKLDKDQQRRSSSISSSSSSSSQEKSERIVGAFKPFK